MILQKRRVVAGAILYPVGDALGALLTGSFTWGRFLGLSLVGASLYAWEVPLAFSIISGLSEERPLRKLLLALLYFNPLWIARHLFFLRLFSGQALLASGLLAASLSSFLISLPLSAVGNYVVQNKLPLSHRFLGSATFSGIMALYSAVMARLLGGIHG